LRGDAVASLAGTRKQADARGRCPCAIVLNRRTDAVRR
jgi:hypothetical protein